MLNPIESDHRQFSEYEVNVRAVLMAYFLGTGEQDVGRALSVLSVCGEIRFEHNFHNHSREIWRKIVKICDEIIQEGKMKRS